MPLKENSKQNENKSLVSFYSDLANSENVANENIGKSMLLFIDMVNHTFRDTDIWGLTSHYRLVLQIEDLWNSPWYVIVNSIGTKEYYFEYLIPTENQPWPNARVTGVAASLEEAKNYLLIAMKESGGWQDSTELQELIRTI